MQHQNEQRMRQFVERVINQGDFAYINEAIHPDYQYTSPDESFSGREALHQLLLGYRTAFPDLHLEITDMVADDHKMGFSFILTGTHQGPLRDVPATGKSVKVHGMVMSRFLENQIVSEHELLDTTTLFTQLGLVGA